MEQIDWLLICKAYQAAANDGALSTDRQKEIARQAGSFLAACSSVGLTALIDEATGYQYDRADDALISTGSRNSSSTSGC